MPQSDARRTLQLLREKEFARYIFTRFIVIFSLFIQSTVLGYLMYTLTGDPLSLGLIGLAEVIPAFGFAFFAGYFVDRHEKRLMYLLCILFYVLNGVLMAGITTTWFREQAGVQWVEWMIYLAMFFSGCVRAFLAPASFSLLPLLAPREHITQAVTWSSTSWMLGSVLGPLCGGVLMAWIGVQPAILCSLACLLLALMLIFSIRPKPLPERRDIGLLKGLAQGFRFVFRTEVILAVLCLDLFAVLFGGAEALLPVFSRDILKVGEVGYGWLRSAHGIGSLCLLFILAWLPLRTRVGPKLFLSVAGFGFCILLFGLSTNVYLSFALLFLAGLFDGVSVVIRHSILQLKTPEDMKGRVSSINMMFISSSNELGAFESGLAARLMGTVPSVVFGGFMTLLVVGFTYFAAPNLKRIRLAE
jgi:MFS family permease